MKNKLFILFLFLGSSKPIIADGSNSQSELLLGFSLLDMNYKEFRDDGFLLDREDGILPGVAGHLKFPNQSFDSYLYGSYHASTIDYDGQTQGGLPVQTDTETDIVDFQYYLSEKSSQKNQIYGGIGYRYWRRDIQSIGNVAGILEHYKWFYGLMGVKTRVFKNNNSEILLDFRITHMLKANMDIDFKGFSATGFASLDDKTVNLGKKTNFRISLPWRKKLENSYTWLIEPYFEQWDIDKSNTVNLTENGALVILPECGGVCGVFEPRSETRNFGVNIQLVMPF